MQSNKYGRTLHAHLSKGSTSDDRFMPKGYIEAFAQMGDDGLVMLEKLDGQNNCFGKNGLFARSHANPSILPWDKPLLQRWKLMQNQLQNDGLEIFGENMYGTHSIAYSKLESYFYVFGVREGENWLSWDDVKVVAELYDFPVVPEIPIKKALRFMVEAYKDENKALSEWIISNLGMDWESYTLTAGALGGYDPLNAVDVCEGLVIRKKGSFKMNDGVIEVAGNEFNNLFKLVRAGHVQTDEHWTKNWSAASLINYEKYGWYGYEHLSR